MALEHDDPEAEQRIRELEAKKLDIHARIAQLKAEYLSLDNDLLNAGASVDRINLLLRW